MSDKRRAKQLRYLRRTGRPTLIRGAELERVQRKIRVFHARGMSYRSMAAQTGVSTRTLAEASGTGGMLRRNWEPLNAMTFLPPSGRELVSALGTERRLGALWHDGFSMDWLAVNYPDVMCRSQLQKTLRGFGKGLVTAATATAVDQLYRKLETTSPESVGIPARSVAYCRTFARKKGYASRGCWDPDTIDDPKAIPEWTGACGTAAGLRIHQREDIPSCPACLATRGEAGPRPRLDGRKLKALREKQGRTIRQVAERLGLTIDAVYAWEIGRSGPRSEELFDRLVTLMGCDYDDLCEEQ